MEFCSVAAVQYNDWEMGILRPKRNEIKIYRQSVYMESICILYLNTFLSVDFQNTLSNAPYNTG